MISASQPPAETTPIPPPPSRTRRWVRGAAWSVSAIVLALAYIRASFGVPVNADCASILLEAQSILAGQIALPGWWLSTVNYYFTDVIWYAVAMAFTGLDPVLMHVVPAIVFCAATLMAVRLSSRGAGQSTWQGMLLAFLLVGLPSQLMPLHAFVGPVHMGTILFVLLAFLGLDQVFRSDKRWGYATYFAFLFMAVFSDTLSAIIAALPVVLHSIASLLRQDANRRRHVRLLSLTGLALVGSVLAQEAVRVLGGFVVGGPPSTSFVALEAFSKNVFLTVQGILLIFGANFFGQPLGLDAVSALLHALGLALACAVLVQVVRAWLRGDSQGDRLSQILALGILLNLSAYLFTGLPVNEITSRYLTPVVFFSAILVGRAFNPQLVTRWRLTYVLPVMALGYLAAFIPVVKAEPAAPPERPVIEWLEANDLRHGYGNFWCASNITVESKGRISVRQLAWGEDTFVPYRWLAHRDWFEKAPPAHFMVFDPTDEVGVTQERAVTVFGEPQTVKQFGRFTVMVWNRDLTPGIKL